MPQGVHAVGAAGVVEAGGSERAAPHHLVEVASRVRLSVVVGEQQLDVERAPARFESREPDGDGGKRSQWVVTAARTSPVERDCARLAALGRGEDEVAADDP